MDSYEHKNNNSSELQECKSALKKALQERDELKEQLSETSEKLVDSEAFKSHFIARISNEIINPFTAIITISENLLKKEKATEQKEISGMVELIHSEASFLDFQLRNLFTAARIEAGELVPETIDSKLLPLVLDSVKGFGKEAHKKGIAIEKEVKLSESEKLKTDPVLLALVVKNLVSNAIKFSEDKSPITIQSSLDNGLFRISVSNKGKQIPEEKREAIFDRFRQLDSRIHSLNPGSGIGLSVAREILELLNGTIEAKPTEEGMRFNVSVAESHYSNGIDQDGESLFFDEEKPGGQSF